MEMMIFAIAIILIVGIAFTGAVIIHKSNEKAYLSYIKVISNDLLDNALSSQIENQPDAAFNYVYCGDSLPLGRISAFLNYFGRNIYDEEPYAFYCKRSSRDNEFREYGCVIARTGIYISKENPGNANLKDKDTTVLKGVEKNIDFSGLSRLFVIGSGIITVNYRPNSIIDKYSFYSVEDPVLRNQIKRVCLCVINGGFGYCLQKGLVAEIIDDIYVGQENVPVNSGFETETTAVDDELFKATEKNLDSKAANVGVAAAGVQAVKPKIAAFFGEVKNLMNGSRGHGYAAEYANNTMDRVLGRDVESAAQQLDDHGRQVKHGADRLVNGIEIQTKYYKTASETIGAVFEKKQAIYIRSDGSGKMMQIEVPRDQYNDALIAMQKRIDSGQVPNVSPGESAKDYVRKGFFTYEQSFNIARAGTVESLAVDAASGAVCCMAAAGVTSVIVFALSVWRGAPPKEAARQCLSTSLSIMGKGTLIYTLTMQLSRKEVAIALAGKVFTADGISQGYKAVANPIYTASENLAAKIAGSNLAKSQVGQKLGLEAINGRQIIGGTVTVAVVFGPDIVRTLQGKISTKQLFKNSAVAAAGMAGAAAAQAAIPIPVVPAIVGGAVAGIAAKKTLDLFIEDDAKEMFRILKEEFIDMTMLTGLSPEEFDEVSKLTVGNKKISKMLQKMFQADDRRLYARIEIMQVAIFEVTQKRSRITRKEYEQGLLELIEEPA